MNHSYKNRSQAAAIIGLAVFASALLGHGSAPAALSSRPPETRSTSQDSVKGPPAFESPTPVIMSGCLQRQYALLSERRLELQQLHGHNNVAFDRAWISTKNELVGPEALMRIGCKP